MSLLCISNRGANRPMVSIRHSRRRTTRAYAPLLALGLVALAICSTYADEPNVYLFDMGSAESPVWPGFTRVTTDTHYGAEIGYGWTTASQELRSYVANRIDALAIDDISGLVNKTATFRLDVPDGDYTVWVLSGAMGNIWRLRYLRQPHDLLLQGQTVRTIAHPEEALFRCANYDWSAEDGVWEQFIQPRFTWYRHDVTVQGEGLCIGFSPALAFPVNALVAAKRSVAPRVSQHIEGIDDRRQAAFEALWQEERPESPPQMQVSVRERQRGYVLARMHCSDEANPWSKPAAGAGRDTMEFFATPGQQEQASFGLFALRDLEQVTFQLSDMTSNSGATLPASAFRRGLVQFAPWHAGRRDSAAYALRECLILPLRPTSVGKETCKRFWLTLQTPENAPAGIYEGTITVQASNAPPTSMALRIRVVPVRLDTPPVERFMYFGTMYYLGKAYLPKMDRERYWQAMRAEVRFMRDNEYCRAECIIPHGRKYLTWEDEKIVDVDMSDTERLLQILREEDAWPRDNSMTCRTGSLNLKLGGHFNRPDNPGVEFVPTEKGRRNFAQAIKIIDQKGRQNGWPEIAFECLGEFSNYREAGRKFAIEVHTLFHDLGVSNTIRGNGPSDFAAIELGLVKYPQPNHAMMSAEQLQVMHRTGQRLWAYNFSRSRFSLGWFCFRHNITRASYESGVYANGQPGNVFDIETMFPMGLPTSMTTIEPTAWLKRLVQGAVDYKYLWNLDRRIMKAQQSGDADAGKIARQARQWLDDKLAQLPDGVDYIAGDPKADMDVQGAFWPVHDLNKYRWQAAEYIMHIDAALEREGDR